MKIVLIFLIVSSFRKIRVCRIDANNTKIASISLIQSIY